MKAKKILGRVVQLGRGAATMMGLALILALVLGVATTAMAAVPGDPFRLGRINTINTVSQLVGSVNNTMLRRDNNSDGASATAVQLDVQPGKAPMKVSSDTRVDKLNADKVDGKNANDLVRVAFKNFNESPVASGNGNVARATINAPTTGFLVINASSNVFNVQQADPLVECLIEVDNNVNDPSRRFMQLNGTSNQEEDCSTNTVVPVAQGNHTIDLEALDVGAETNFDQTTLSAIFVPFDGNGAPPVK
jgi:hypothetical protein